MNKTDRRPSKARPVSVSVSVPAPTIMTGGLANANGSQYRISGGGKANGDGKPPYRVPSMTEIAALEKNGLVAADLFSGCGGSCLGFRMAGFRVAWANEFVPHAQECYKANFPETILDCRDVRTIQPKEILKAMRIKQGALDVLSGSPPCQAFSTAGQREKGWGKEKAYEHGAHQKNETLFDEFVRMLRGLLPKVFVAENVSGLAKGTCKGFFLEILAALKASGYVVECRLLDAQWLGVPQQRQRLIFVGVRTDIAEKCKVKPEFPSPMPYRYSVADACPWIGNRITGRIGTGYKRRPMSSLKPALAIQATGDAQTRFEIEIEKRKFTIAELRRICSFPDDFILVGSYAQQWARLGNAVPPVMAAKIAETIRDKIFAACDSAA